MVSKVQLQSLSDPSFQCAVGAFTNFVREALPHDVAFGTGVNEDRDSFARLYIELMDSDTRVQ
jgi:hypothetical protein